MNLYNNLVRMIVAALDIVSGVVTIPSFGFVYLNLSMKFLCWNTIRHVARVRSKE